MMITIKIPTCFEEVMCEVWTLLLKWRITNCNSLLSCFACDMQYRRCSLLYNVKVHASAFDSYCGVVDFV